MPKKPDQPLTENKAQKMIDRAVDDVAQATNKAFEHVQDNMLTREDAKQFLTKEDAKQFLTKEDAKQFASKQDVARLERGQQALLKVMQGIDQQLKEHRTHPQRIERLERTVFR